MPVEKVLISVGMPVFNCEKYVSHAIGSILSQTFTNFELIISDNGSNDLTEKICQDYCNKDDRVRYFRQSENRGAAENFKFVLRNASGKYFMWAAADDLWSPNWLEEMLKLQNIKNCIAFSSLQAIGDDGRCLSHPANKCDLNFNSSRLFRRMKYFLIPNVLGKANPIYGLFPRNFISKRDMSILDCSYFGVDMLFVYSLLERLPIIINDQAVFYKRISKKEMSSKFNYWNFKHYNRFISCFSGLMICKYVRLSSVLESFGVLCLAPIAFVYSSLARFLLVKTIK